MTICCRLQAGAPLIVDNWKTKLEMVLVKIILYEGDTPSSHLSRTAKKKVSDKMSLDHQASKSSFKIKLQNQALKSRVKIERQSQVSKSSVKIKHQNQALKSSIKIKH